MLFFSVFGIPIFIEDENFSEDIVDDLLNQLLTVPFESSNPNDYKISDTDMQSYINYARSLSTEFDPRANVMLENYFIATKTIRPGNVF